jgi:hypothetical protein
MQVICLTDGNNTSNEVLISDTAMISHDIIVKSFGAVR